MTLQYGKIGIDKKELDTPVICIDLDIMESNIKKLSDFMRKRGKNWRPHQKCHKSPVLAWREIEAGAIGVTCAKLSEAEVMAQAGIKDILIANMIVGEQKLKRLTALCRWANPIVAVDSIKQAEPLAAACADCGVECRVVVELDIGLERVGCRSVEEALKLARKVNTLKGIKLVGIMGYEGHLIRIEDPREKREKINKSIDILRQTRDRMLAEGLDCSIVSAGGTGSYQYTSDCECITELQAGGGIFADPMYQLECGVKGLGYALSVLCTVVSRPEPGVAIIDAGGKALGFGRCKPIIKGYPDAKAGPLSAEHGKIILGETSQETKIGDKLELIVGYSDFTTMLHEAYYGFRDEKLEMILPIPGRSKLQ